MHPASQRKQEDVVKYKKSQVSLGELINVPTPEDYPLETPLHFPWRANMRDLLFSAHG